MRLSVFCTLVSTPIGVCVCCPKHHDLGFLSHIMCRHGNHTEGQVQQCCLMEIMLWV